MAGWEVVIGLEIHAQLATKSKIFSGSATAYGAPPNTQASLVDLAYPGVLPVLNAEAVRMAVKFGLSIGAEVARHSVFARKNYFYPDLPKGYQISQYELPVVKKGKLKVMLDDGAVKIIGVTRAHLEEDAGKSLHEGLANATGIDLNRAGTPLLEIVSEPDMRSAKEAVAYMKKIHTLVRYLEICDGNMQEGSFRCDANVSVRPRGREKFGTRAEIKNLNSFRFVEKAINYEVARQIDLLESGGTVVQETRLYDSDKDETRSMRSKEEANDYRYFPDPDLLPVQIDESFIDAVRATLPELPDEKAARFARDGSLGVRCRGPEREPRARRVFRGGRGPARCQERQWRCACQAGCELGHGRIVERPESRQYRDHGLTRHSRATERPAGANRRSDHLRQDRQGGIRGDVVRRRVRGRHHRGEGSRADHGLRRHRRSDRRRDRRQSQTARRLPFGQG